MSRIAKAPIDLPAGVSVGMEEQSISVKGPKGENRMVVNDLVKIRQDNGQIKVEAQAESTQAVALAGTTRALINNMVRGVFEGFEKKLNIVGVGYRAQSQGQTLNLTLGFSHPVVYQVPEGISVETPTQTEIIVKGSDKQRVGQVASEIRRYRPPEPYKGKGVRYADEVVVRKQAKKK